MTDNVMLEANYQITVCGICVRIIADDEEVIRVIRRSFWNFLKKNIEILKTAVCEVYRGRTSTRIREDDDLLELWRKTTSTDTNEVILERSEKGIVYHTRCGVWWFTGTARSVCILSETVWEDEAILAGDDFFYVVLRPMLYESLWQCGVYWIHGAGIQHNQFGAILVVGDRHHGKSTTAVAFWNAGHKVLSDDNVFVARRDKRLIIQTMYRDFHLDPSLGGKFASLPDLMQESPVSEEEEKVSVTLQLFKKSLVEEIEAPRYIIFPKIVADIETTGKAIGKPEALELLLANSYPGLIGINEQQTIDFLETIESFCHIAKCYKMYSGSDCYDDPHLYVPIIEQLVSG